MLRGVAMIDVLHGRGHIVGSIAPVASQWAVATVVGVLTAAVENKQICCSPASNFEVGDQWRVYGPDSGLVIDPCYGGGQKDD
uniref:Uncharacterized protein n=1 Tax=Romanomermis culicivorax TaxID=13658 RepID=A0A915JLN3_ROMCU